MVCEGRNGIERRERNIRRSQSFADFEVAKLTEDVLHVVSTNSRWATRLSLFEHLESSISSGSLQTHTTQLLPFAFILH